MSVYIYRNYLNNVTALAKYLHELKNTILCASNYTAWLLCIQLCRCELQAVCVQIVSSTKV